MVTALYRRYRPETFADLIGQEQVTEPLSAALRSGRINHAYLFSGPRGCGKTTSARILARCLNCAEGPTPDPCGVCPSCVELARDGSGSLDVVEIDAASHNGVDDARDLRERAIFAPARDRYKIFILDEAHMVTAQGFNALLKIVEEPPEHVKFIFATTEPDKVIGTIRSRTHHYPFRLIPQNQMLDYVEKLAGMEGITAETGVFPLAVKAGGGSARDTLSIVDQLIAGTVGDRIDYDSAVGLLGYTHQALLDELIGAFADGAADRAFHVVNTAVDNGQDPRRFVEDILERFRDLIVVAAGGMKESALPGLSDAEMTVYQDQAALLGKAKLSLLADLTLASLDQLSGATSPKLQLELMLARMMVALGGGQPAAIPATAPVTTAPVTAPVTAAIPAAIPDAVSTPVETPVPVQAAAPATSAEHTGPVDIDAIRKRWPVLLEQMQSRKVSAWLLVSNTEPLSFDDDVLTLGFKTERDFIAFRQQGDDTPSSILRQLIQDAFGIVIKYRAIPLASAPVTAPSEEPTPPEDSEGTPPESDSVPESTPDETVQPQQVSAPQQVATPQQVSTPKRPQATVPSNPTIDAERFGEPIIRQVLGAVPMKNDRI